MIPEQVKNLSQNINDLEMGDIISESEAGEICSFIREFDAPKGSPLSKLQKVLRGGESDYVMLGKMKKIKERQKKGEQFLEAVAHVESEGFRQKTRDLLCDLNDHIDKADFMMTEFFQDYGVEGLGEFKASIDWDLEENKNLVTWIVGHDRIQQVLGVALDYIVRARDLLENRVEFCNT